MNKTVEGDIEGEAGGETLKATTSNRFMPMQAPQKTAQFDTDDCEEPTTFHVSWKFPRHTARTQQCLPWGKPGKLTKPDENDHTVNWLRWRSNNHSMTATQMLHT